MTRQEKRAAEIEETVKRRREYLDGNAPAGMGPEPSEPPEPTEPTEPAETGEPVKPAEEPVEPEMPEPEATDPDTN